MVNKVLILAKLNYVFGKLYVQCSRYGHVVHTLDLIMLISVLPDKVYSNTYLRTCQYVNEYSVRTQILFIVLT